MAYEHLDEGRSLIAQVYAVDLLLLLKLSRQERACEHTVVRCNHNNTTVRTFSL